MFIILFSLLMATFILPQNFNDFTSSVHDAQMWSRKTQARNNSLVAPLLPKANQACLPQPPKLSVENHPSLDMKTIANTKKPATCNNFQCGKYDGICGFNATLHIVGAGIHNSLREFPEQKQDFSNHNELLNRFFDDSKRNQQFSFTPDEIKNEFCEPRELLKYEINVIIKNDGNIHHEKIRLEDIIQQNFKPNATKNANQLIYINLCYPISEKDEKQRPPFDIPQKLTLKNEHGTYYYALAGVVGAHKYRQNNKHSWLRSQCANTLRLFNDYSPITNNIPSKLITNWYDTCWENHVDAYVKYGNTWYIMDDQTRWTVQAKNIDSQIIESDPDIILQTLLNNYPGYPSKMIYAQIAAEHTPTAQSTKPRNLILERDTQRTSLAKNAGVLLSCFLADSIVTSLSLQLFHIDTINSFKLGSIVGMISCIYHSMHLASLRKNKITYQENSKLGPRAPLL